MSEAYLTVGDTSLTGALNLIDSVNYFIIGGQQPLSMGGSTVPVGINFGALERGVIRGQGTPPVPGSRPITIGLACLGSTYDAVVDNWNALERMVEQARLASGPWAQGTQICFRYKPATATNPVYFDVLGGALTIVYDGIPDGKLICFGTLRLDCMPYSHGAAITDTVSGTITNGASGSSIYRAAVPGTVESLVTTTLTDKSTGLGSVTGLACTQGAGTLAAGTYYYRVSAVNVYGSNIPCAEQHVAIAASHGVTLNWNPVTGARIYNIYGRTTGAEQFIASTANTTYTDSGSISPSGPLPVSDASVPLIVRWTLTRVARLPSMGSTDFAGLVKLTAASPGTTGTDSQANYTGAGFATLIPTAAWQTVAEAMEPVGAFNHGYCSFKLRARDFNTAVLPPSNGSVSTLATGGNLPDGVYGAYLTTYIPALNNSESTPLALPAAIVPINQEVFFDGAESGDTSLWAAQVLASVGTSLSGSVASINAETDAAYTATVGSAYGFRANSGGGSVSGMGTWIYQAGFSGNTAAIRLKIRINTDSGAVSSTAWNAIPLLVKADGTWLIGLANIGVGWKFATLAAGTMTTSGVAIQLSDGSGWQTLECVFAWNGSTSYTCTAYIADTQTVSTTISSAVAPGYLAIGAYSVGASTQLQVDFDNVQMASAHIGAPTGSITWTWTAASIRTAYGSLTPTYNLYVQRANSVWQKINSLTGTSYTLTALTAGAIVTGPPSGAPNYQPGNWRIGVAVNAANLPDTAFTWSRTAFSAVEAGEWESLHISPLPLPPMPRQMDGTEDSWRIRVQALESPAGNEMDVDIAYLLPHNEQDDVCVVEAIGLTLPQAGMFKLDHRWDDTHTCDIYDAATGLTVIGQARVRGRFSFGPGDNIYVVEAECASPITTGAAPVSDVLGCKWTVQNTLRPRYMVARGGTL